MDNIILGLGNPGGRYAGTRHNVGMAVLEEAARRRDLGWADGGDDFDVAEISPAAVLIRPKTFVNLSGLAAVGALARYGAAPETLFVISDDFHLPLGRLRIRLSGSSGGHRGLISIIERLATENFPRMRLGIGPLSPESAGDEALVRQFVLSRFAVEDEKIVNDMIARAVKALDLVIAGEIDRAIRTYNSNPTPEV